MDIRLRLARSLPMPRSVICSPSHIRKTVPVTSVIIAVIRNAGPGLTTRPDWVCNQDAAAIDWKLASATVP